MKLFYFDNHWSEITLAGSNLSIKQILMFMRYVSRLRVLVDRDVFWCRVPLDIIHSLKEPDRVWYGMVYLLKPL